MVIETGEIKMSSKKMLSVLFMQNGILWLVITLIGIIGFAIAGAVYDLRFFILALIWIFLIIPLVIAFLYFFYGMEPLTAFNTIPHKVIISENDVKVVLIEENDEEEKNKTKDYTVSRELFKEIKKGPDYLLIFFKKNGWLWLPFSELNSQEDIISLMKIR